MARMRQPDRSAQVRQAQLVRNIRSRYAQALAYGYDAPEAARLANGDDEIKPRKAVLAPTSALIAVEETRSQTVSIQGSANPHVAASEDAPTQEGTPLEEIPPNWEELPWPDLVALATRLSGGRFVKSRAHAISVVHKALGIT